ncbi:phosphoribosylaminoimidazolesuccinocarboxamide synthase [bacterium]|nr:phosphoribosylaminoimidazolesuccinocarboxamide synthase [bacterium]
MQTKEMLYEGKAKKIYKTDKENILLMEYKDSLTAFNALKKGNFEGKGALNCKISTLIFKLLAKHGIAHHWLETKDDKYMVVHQTKIIPLEVVVRNYIAGSLAKKLGKTEGESLKQPIVEFYYKDDALNDPFVNDEQIIALGWATQSDLQILKKQALEINTVLSTTFKAVGLKLIDFKIEFGFNYKNEIILSDEISPDCMRLWDAETNKKLDKDRFRQDLGAVDAAYMEVYERLNKGVQL